MLRWRGERQTGAADTSNRVARHRSPGRTPGKSTSTTSLPSRHAAALERHREERSASAKHAAVRSDADWMTEPLLGAALLGLPLPETSADGVESPGLVFLRSLHGPSIDIAPLPVIIGRDGARIEISLRGTPPRDAPTPRIRWQLVRDKETEPLARGEHAWPLRESIPLWFADTYRLICEVEIEGIGSRVLTRRFTARDDTLDSTRALADDELLGEQKALRGRLATETDPATRETLRASYEHARWIAHERGIQSYEDWARNMDAAQGRHVLPEDAEGMRAYVERSIASHGRPMGMFWVALALGADAATPEQRALGHQQLALVVGEADALEREFETRAMRTAWLLLDRSARQIGDILRGYGLSLDIDDLVWQLARNDGDTDVDAIADRLLARSKRDSARPKGTYQAKADERAALANVVADLQTRQQHLHGLYAERASLMQERDDARPIAFDPMREHPSHHERRDPLRDSRLLDRLAPIDPGVLASHSPAFADLLNVARQPPPSGNEGDPDRTALLDLWLAATDADIERARIAYKTRWLEAERAHPILVTYRARPGQEADLSALTGRGDDERMLGVLCDVLPRLANIAKAGTWLKSGDLDPLELPPVVDLAKTSLLIVPGSMRERIVDDLVADASDDSLEEWAIAAVTLGLAVLSAAPSGGGSIVLLAELGGLALDAYLAMETCADFTIESAVAGTSIDPSLALANEEPSLTWLAVQLVATGLGAAFVVKTFREAARLRRMAEAGESAQAAMRHLDELGQKHGLGKLGSRIVEEAGEHAGIARRVSRPGLYSDRVGQYAAENPDGLARRLGTGVALDPGLGSGVRIDRFVHDDGDIWVIGLRVGPDATTADVLAHGRTIELMRRYNGTIGDLRALLDRGLGKAVHAPGSEQEIASLEAEKLRRLIRERQRALSALSPDRAAPALEQEIAFLRQELTEWEGKRLAKEPGKVVVGFGEIGSPDLGKANVRVGLERIATTRAAGKSVDAVVAYIEALDHPAEFLAALERTLTVADHFDADHFAALLRQATQAADPAGYLDDIHWLSTLAPEARGRLAVLVASNRPPDLTWLRAADLDPRDLELLATDTTTNWAQLQQRSLLAEDLPEEIRAVVGKRIDELPEAPPGTEFWTPEKGKTRLRWKRDQAIGRPSLSLDSRGHIVVGGADDLNRAALSRNMRKREPKLEGHQDHHLIPIELARDHELCQAARTRGNPRWDPKRHATTIDPGGA